MVLVHGASFYGIPYVVISRDELIRMGLVLNPNMYISDGFFHCPNCNHYTYHFAMSHSGASDCFELCKDCNSFVAPRAVAVLKGLVV